MSLLMRGAEFLSERRDESMSVEVLYTRPDQTPITINATPGRVSGEASQLEPMTIDSDRVEWVIKASDLVIDSTLTVPAIGDQMTYENNGITMVYEVNHDQLEKCYRYADEFKLDMIIHTVQGAIS